MVYYPKASKRVILSRKILDHMELRTLQSASAQLEFGKPSGLTSVNLKSFCIAALATNERSRMISDENSMRTDWHVPIALKSSKHPSAFVWKIQPSFADMLDMDDKKRRKWDMFDVTSRFPAKHWADAAAKRCGMLLLSYWRGLVSSSLEVSSSQCLAFVSLVSDNAMGRVIAVWPSIEA